MLLENFRPQSKLVTKTTLVDKPKFPVIDAHNHLGDPFGGGWDKKPLSELLDLLDEAGVTHYVDLDGGWGEDILYAHLKHFKEGAPERFQVFGGVDWSQWATRGDEFADWAASRLKIQKEAGAQGLKIWKPFGLHVKDHKGQLVKVDDARLSPIWETAGELGLPVLIHVADPVAGSASKSSLYGVFKVVRLTCAHADCVSNPQSITATRGMTANALNTRRDISIASV